MKYVGLGLDPRDIRASSGFDRGHKVVIHEKDLLLAYEILSLLLPGHEHEPFVLSGSNYIIRWYYMCDSGYVYANVHVGIEYMTWAEE